MLNQDINILLRPDAILFDWDMTLANSWQAIYTALNNTLTEFGHPTWTEAQAKENSQQALRDYFPAVFGDVHNDAKDFFYSNFEKIHLDHIKLMPYAKEVLELLAYYNIPMAVVSNKSAQFLPAEVNYLKVAPLMKAVIGSGMAAKDKPDPAPVWVTLEAMGLPKEGTSIWFVGDTITDARAAVASGSTNIIINESAGIIEDFPEDLQPDIYFADMKSFLDGLSSYFKKLGVA